MPRYRIGTPEDLGRHLKVVHGKFPKETEKALRRAARGSVSAVVTRTAAMPNPPVDTGQFLRSFTVKDVKGGALLYSSESYAVIIEAGRKPGRAPPRAEIRDWLKRKRLVPRSKKKRGKKSTKRNAKSGSKGLSKEKRAKKRVKRLQVHRISDVDLEGVVTAVVMKIARRGIAGRFPVRKTLPDMRKILAKELAPAMKRMLKPRGR